MVKPAVSRNDVEELYRRHAGELHGYLYRRAGQAGADLLGDVFVVVLQRLGDLPEPDLRRAWLFSTARRLLLAAERNTRKRHHAENERARFHEPTAGNRDVDRSDRDRAVRDALASLREQDRELIRLTEWSGLRSLKPRWCWACDQAQPECGYTEHDGLSRPTQHSRASSKRSPTPSQNPSTLSSNLGPPNPEPELSDHSAGNAWR